MRFSRHNLLLVGMRIKIPAHITIDNFSMRARVMGAYRAMDYSYH